MCQSPHEHLKHILDEIVYLSGQIERLDYEAFSADIMKDSQRKKPPKTSAARHGMNLAHDLRTTLSI
jgi:hypothetical protein